MTTSKDVTIANLQQKAVMLARKLEASEGNNNELEQQLEASKRRIAMLETLNAEANSLLSVVRREYKPDLSMCRSIRLYQDSCELYAENTAGSRPTYYMPNVILF